MKKKLTALITSAACALCAVAMCLVIAGCGGSTSAAEPVGKDMLGYWELTSGKADGEELTAEEVEFMASIDVKFLLYLAEDGTATVDTFGTVEDLTWDYDKATLAYAGVTGTFKLSGGTLIYGDGGSNELVFKKGDDSAAEKIEQDRKSMEEGAAGTAVETQRVAIDPPIVIADDEVANITAVARVVDENGMGGIELAIVNKSGERFATHTLTDGTVNGRTYETYDYADVNAGETANEVVAFDGITTIDELKDVNFTLTVYEVKYFNDLGVYEVSIP
ncbi:MAG: hypothetical protein Q4B45_01060 [Coriobacteriia bacterium]|nr:hypothetical protein [Coriobacteriia bacterium]